MLATLDKTALIDTMSVKQTAINSQGNVEREALKVYGEGPVILRLG